MEIFMNVDDYLKEIILWRGHYPVQMRIPWINSSSVGAKASTSVDRWSKEISFKFPLNSVVAFVWGIFLSRDFELFPSFLAFSIGWMLLSTMEGARNHPSPWRRPLSYWEILQAILWKNMPCERKSIEADENLSAVIDFEKKRKETLEAQREVLEQMRQQQEKFDAYAMEENNKNVDENARLTVKINEKVSQFSLLPFKSVLLSIQLVLYKVCVSLRITKSIIIWRESTVAFWITTASFLVSLVLWWFPWNFLLSWSFKIVVWTFLGPWMKLVDIYYFRHRDTPECEKAAIAEQFRKKCDALMGASLQRRIRQEDARKKQGMKKYLFGKVRSYIPSLYPYLYFLFFYSSSHSFSLLNWFSFCTVLNACSSIQGRACI